jgi:hypothetical protein
MGTRETVVAHRLWDQQNGRKGRRRTTRKGSIGPTQLLGAASLEVVVRNEAVGFGELDSDKLPDIR